MAEGYGHGRSEPPASKPPMSSLPPNAAQSAALAPDGEFTVTPEIRAALIAAGWTPPPSLAERVRKIATRDRTRG